MPPLIEQWCSQLNWQVCRNCKEFCLCEVKLEMMLLLPRWGVWKADRDSTVLPWLHHLHNLEYQSISKPLVLSACICWYLVSTWSETLGLRSKHTEDVYQSSALFLPGFYYLCPANCCLPCYVNEVCLDLTLNFDPQYHTWQSVCFEHFQHILTVTTSQTIPNY